MSYIEDAKMDDLLAPIFKLSDLATLYSNRLEQLGTIVSGRVHSTKRKDRILSYFPDMETHTQGREVVLIFNKDVGIALGKACEHDTNSDAVHLARAATIVRRDMFNKRREFNGSFHTVSGTVCANFIASTSYNGTQWTKHQMSNKFLISTSAISNYLSFYYTTAQSATRRM